MSHHPCVVVIPCSGIGKAFGTVSREAAYELCENFRPADTNLVALSKLVLGERGCASPSPHQSGGHDRRLQADVRVETREAQWWDCRSRDCGSRCVSRYKDLKPEGIAELNEPGKELARVIAAEISETLDEVLAESQGGHHA